MASKKRQLPINLGDTSDTSDTPDLQTWYSFKPERYPKWPYGQDVGLSLTTIGQSTSVVQAVDRFTHGEDIYNFVPYYDSERDDDIPLPDTQGMDRLEILAAYAPIQAEVNERVYVQQNVPEPEPQSLATPPADNPPPAESK